MSGPACRRRAASMRDRLTLATEARTLFASIAAMTGLHTAIRATRRSRRGEGEELVGRVKRRRAEDAPHLGEKSRAGSRRPIGTAAHERCSGRLGRFGAAHLGAPVGAEEGYPLPLGNNRTTGACAQKPHTDTELGIEEHAGRLLPGNMAGRLYRSAARRGRC